MTESPNDPTPSGAPGSGAGETGEGVWPYLGVGCLSAVIGLVGGGMIAVLFAKVFGAFRKCTPDPETLAPCDWNTWWTWGARLGLFLVPTIVIWRMWRGRARVRRSQRG